MTPADPPPPVSEPAPRRGGRISLVWLVPLLALLVSLAVAWRAYSDRGPLIHIIFEDANGIVAGETTLRFRNVTVGMVESVAFGPDLESVDASVRLSKDLADYVDEEAQFWVVRPRVTAQGVSGIETVLSGVYIEGYWDGTPGERETSFVALDQPPLTPSDQPGLRVQLHAPDAGSVSVGAPVLFKSIQVGKIETVELSDAGDVIMDIFVDAPHHLRLTEATRFWNASGFSIELSAAGAALNVDSLASLLQGGIAFDTVGSDLAPVEEGHLYELYASQTVARQNAFEDAPGLRLLLDTYFDGSVRGLEPGAPVEFRGIRVGEVTALQAAIVEDAAGPRIVLRATLSVLPARFGIVAAEDADPAATAEAALDLIAAQVAEGLRAQLASSGLLTQTLYVDLVDLPDPAPADLARDAEPYPVLPSAPSEVSGIAASAESVLQRVQNLPVEELLETATTLLASVNRLVSDEAVRTAPENLGLLLADLRTLVNDSGLMEAPEDLRALIASAQALVAEAEEQQLVATLAQTLEAARTALADVGTAVAGVPQLIATLDALATRAAELPLDELVATATQAIADIDALVSSEALAGLPAELETTIAEARGLLEALREGGAVENATATLASLRQVADELAEAEFASQIATAIEEARLALANVSAASENLPRLIDSLSALSDQAAALPLDELVTSASALVAQAQALVADEAVAAVPARVNAALAELNALLTRIREGGAVENASAALASIRTLADEAAAAGLVASLPTVLQEVRLVAGNVSAASTDLPQLIDTLTRLSDKAAALPLDALTVSATEALDAIDDFLATDSAQSVPDALGAALEEARGILADLRAGGAVESLNATLASAEQAAAAFSTATADLPALIAELRSAAERASGAIDTIGPGSEINRDTQLLLRDLREAARAVDDLVTALERRPNSVLFGR